MEFNRIKMLIRIDKLCQSLQGQISLVAYRVRVLEGNESYCFWQLEICPIFVHHACRLDHDVLHVECLSEVGELVGSLKIARLERAAI